MIMNLAGLSYLGLGVVTPTPEWGSMMSEGRSMLQTISVDCIGTGIGEFYNGRHFNLLGDTVRDILDPKQKRRSITNNMKKVKNIVSGNSKREKSLV